MRGVCSLNLVSLELHDTPTANVRIVALIEDQARSTQASFSGLKVGVASLEIVAVAEACDAKRVPFRFRELSLTGHQGTGELRIRKLAPVDGRSLTDVAPL